MTGLRPLSPADSRSDEQELSIAVQLQHLAQRNFKA